MNQEPLVSIGIPTYNRPIGLRNTLECMINQTYKNIEIIVSDNGSLNPEVSKVIKEFLQKDNRIKYYRQIKNLGAEHNFKFVKEQASGEYFMWASDDDLWDTIYIEEGLKILLSQPRYKAWFCTIENIDSFGRMIRKYNSFSRFTSGKNKWADIIKFVFEAEILGKANLIYSIYEIKPLESIMEKYFINGKWGSDNCFNLAFLIHYDIYVSDQVLLQKRVERVTDNINSIEPIVISNPMAHIFPFTKSIEYMKENFYASRYTKYWPIVLIIVFFKSCIALFNAIYFKFKNLFIKG